MNLVKLTRGFLVLALAAFGTVVLNQAPAQAHTWTTYFVNGRWPTNQSIAYGVATGFPTGEWRSRLLDGKNQWNNATSTGEPSIWWTLADDVDYGDSRNACTIPGFNTAAVYWRDLNYLGSSVLGATRLCNLSGTVVNFGIELDSTRSSWYTGTGDNPSGRDDAWSVATHEFGHALGFWNHIAEGDSACPNDSSRATMCPTIYTGTERQRTVAPHDVHTFDAAY